MLHFIRERAKGFFAWLIVGLIIIPFAFFGINSYFDGGSADSVVARVDGVEITTSEFQRLYVRERTRRQEILGGNTDPALLNDVLIKRDVIDRLVNSAAVTQSAIDAGLRISDAQLRQEIVQNQQFQRDDRFDGELYARLLGSQGLTQEGFEAQIRQDLLVGQLISGITSSEFATEKELIEFAGLEGQQRDIGYMILTAKEHIEDATPTDDQVMTYYESNLDRYAITEQVSVEYLELSAQDLIDNIVVDEAALRKFYDEQQADFTANDERQASHILISVDPEAGENSDKAARDKAFAVLEKIKAGESFEALAETESDDVGTAVNGGDLGFFSRGMMVKPFEDAAFSMSVGDVSEPVRSAFGYHIIKLTDIKAQKIKTFEEMRDTLENEYRELKAEEQFYDIADQIADLTYEAPDTLEVAAQELGLTIKISPLFSRHSGDGIGANPKIRVAAFSQDVLEAGNNSEPITLKPDHLIVLRIKEHRASSHRPLEEVRDKIVQSLQREAAEEKVISKGQEIVQRATSGELTSVLAKSFNSEWHDTGFVARDESSVPSEILRAAFRINNPTQEKPSIEGLEMSSGDYAVISVNAVRSANREGKSEDGSDALDQEKNLIIRKYGSQVGNSVLQGIKKRAKIEINQNNL